VDGKLVISGIEINENAPNIDLEKRVEFLRRAVFYFSPLPSDGVLDEQNVYISGPDLFFNRNMILCDNGLCATDYPLTDPNRDKNNQYWSLQNGFVMSGTTERQDITKELGGQVIPPSALRYMTNFPFDGNTKNLETITYLGGKNGYLMTENRIDVDNIRYPVKILLKVFDMSESDTCNINILNAGNASIKGNKWYFFKGKNYILNEFYVPSNSDNANTPYTVTITKNCSNDVGVVILPQNMTIAKDSGFVDFMNINGGQNTLYYTIVNTGAVKLSDALKINNYYEDVAPDGKPIYKSININSTQWVGNNIYLRSGQALSFGEDSWYDFTGDDSNGYIINEKTSNANLVMIIAKRPALLCKGTAKEMVDDTSCNKGNYQENGQLVEYCKVSFATCDQDSNDDKNYTDGPMNFWCSVGQNQIFPQLMCADPYFSDTSGMSSCDYNNGDSISSRNCHASVKNKKACPLGCAKRVVYSSSHVFVGDNWSDVFTDNASGSKYQIYFADKDDKKQNDLIKSNTCADPLFDNSGKFIPSQKEKTTNNNTVTIPPITYYTCKSCYDTIKNTKINPKREANIVQCYDLETYVGSMRNFNGNSDESIDGSGLKNGDEVIKYGRLSKQDYELGAKKLSNFNNIATNYANLETLILDDENKNENGTYRKFVYKSSQQGMPIKRPTLVQMLVLTKDDNFDFSSMPNVTGYYNISYRNVMNFTQGQQLSVIIADKNWDRSSLQDCKSGIDKKNCVRKYLTRYKIQPSDVENMDYGRYIQTESSPYYFSSSGMLVSNSGDRKYVFDGNNDERLYFKVIDRRFREKGVCKTWQETEEVMNYSCDNINWSKNYPSQSVDGVSIAGCGFEKTKVWCGQPSCGPTSIVLKDVRTIDRVSEDKGVIKSTLTKKKLTTEADCPGEQIVGSYVYVCDTSFRNKDGSSYCPIITNYTCASSGHTATQWKYYKIIGGDWYFIEKNCPENGAGDKYVCSSLQNNPTKWLYTKKDCDPLDGPAGYSCAKTQDDASKWKFVSDTNPCSAGQYCASSEDGLSWVITTGSSTANCLYGGGAGCQTETEIIDKVNNKCEQNPQSPILNSQGVPYYEIVNGSGGKCNAKWWYNEVENFGVNLPVYSKVMPTGCRDIYDDNSGNYTVTLKAPRSFTPQSGASGIFSTNVASYLGASASGLFVKYLVQPLIEEFDGKSMGLQKTPASSMDNPTFVPCDGASNCVKYRGSAWKIGCIGGDNLCYEIDDQIEPKFIPCDDTEETVTNRCKVYYVGLNNFNTLCKKGTENCVKVCTSSLFTNNCGVYTNRTNNALEYDANFGVSCVDGQDCYRTCSSLPNELQKSLCVRVNDNGGFAQRFYIKIITNGYYNLILKICLTLMVAFYGLYTLIGYSKLNYGELINRAAKIAFIYLMVGETGWFYYEKYFVKFFKEGVDYLVYSVVGSFDQTGDIAIAFKTQDFYDKSVLFSGVDRNISLIFSMEVSAKIFGLLFVSFFGWAYVILIYNALITYVFMMAQVMMTYIIAQILVSILLGFGPIFFVLLVFDKTKEMFTKWVNSLLSFSLEQIFLLSVVGLFSDLIYGALKFTLSYKVCYKPAWTLNLPLIGNINVLFFWRASTARSASGVSNSIPGLFRILLVWILADLIERFMGIASGLATSFGGSGISAKNIGGSIIDTIDSARTALTTKSGDALGKIPAAVAGRLIGYKTDAQEKKEEEQDKVIRGGINAANEAGKSARNEVIAKAIASGEGINDDVLNRAANAQQAEYNKTLKDSKALNKYMEQQKENGRDIDADTALKELSKKTAASFTGRGNGVFGQAMSGAWRTWGNDSKGDRFIQNTREADFGMGGVKSILSDMQKTEDRISDLRKEKGEEHEGKNYMEDFKKAKATMETMRDENKSIQSALSSYDKAIEKEQKLANKIAELEESGKDATKLREQYKKMQEKHRENADFKDLEEIFGGTCYYNQISDKRTETLEKMGYTGSTNELNPFTYDNDDFRFSHNLTQEHHLSFINQDGERIKQWNDLNDEVSRERQNKAFAELRAKRAAREKG
jgi:type IV secretory pathway VirB6-like protein